LPGSLAPFVVRRCRLIGVNAMDAPIDERGAVWQALGRAFSDTKTRQALVDRTRSIDLEQVPEFSARILQGEETMRVIVDLTGKD